jgi:GTP pyrophosphokinase
MINSNINTSMRFGEVLEYVKSYHPDADTDFLSAAYFYSARVHADQKRRSGEPYLVHPVAVAGILAQMRLDEASIITGLLHDTVEDTLTTVKDLENDFGPEIASLVDGVTKISKMEFQSKAERQAESFRKMILAMSKDIRVLLVKLADRFQNMTTLDFLSPEAKKRIARETMDIYAPLAGRIGIHWLRTSLEDLSFKHLSPEIYGNIEQRLENTMEETEAYKNKVLEIINDKLKQYNIEPETKSRTKNVWSIHRKMLSQNIDLEQVHDITAFRIILDSVSQCYAVLGLIHSLWRPVPGRFKDYVAMPKGNGYQSLHTTVIGPEGKRIEIQIRTHEMDLIAEHGIAAHWSYKEGKAVEGEDANVISRLRKAMEWQEELEDATEFFESVRVDLYPDEVHVFTPTGEVKEFPKGATPIDFAYAIHTEVGQTCAGARVNGKMVPLKYQLQNGDMVEIITSANQKPSKDWLKYVKTGKARTKIRHYVLSQERERSIEIGREGVERELRKWRLDIGHAEKSGEILEVARDHSLRAEQDLYAAIGYGRISPKVIITKLVPAHEREKAKAELHEDRLFKREARTTDKSGVRVQGIADVMVNFAKCCSPLPGDHIVGFITRGRGVTVHQAKCSNVEVADHRRLLDVSWDEEQPRPWLVKLRIDSHNRTGLLASISGVFSSNDSDIAEATVRTVDTNKASGIFSVYVKNLDHLDRIVSALKAVKGVDLVERLRA